MYAPYNPRISKSDIDEALAFVHMNTVETITDHVQTGAKMADNLNNWEMWIRLFIVPTFNLHFFAVIMWMVGCVMYLTSFRMDASTDQISMMALGGVIMGWNIGRVAGGMYGVYRNLRLRLVLYWMFVHRKK